MYKWLKADLSLLILTLLGLAFIRADIIMIIAFIAVIVLLIFTDRKTLLKYLLLSTIISLVWIVIAGKIYDYENGFLTIGIISIFPLFAWANGLYLLKHISTYLDIDNIKKTTIITISYIILLLIIETIAYHLFHMRNVATAHYPGIPICNCIHAPLFMQIVYILLGPIYYALTLLLDKIYKNNVSGN
jgi:hypothetical protein